MIQEFEDNIRVFIYLSRCLLDTKTRYTELDQMCLCLYFTCTKLRHYLIKVEARIICKVVVIKHMLLAPILKGQLGKWMHALSKFDLCNQLAKHVKGHALVDLIIKRTPPPTFIVGLRT
jgi:hypothetical protein